MNSIIITVRSHTAEICYIKPMSLTVSHGPLDVNADRCTVCWSPCGLASVV